MFWRFKYFRMGSLGLPASTPENRFMRVKHFPKNWGGKKNGSPEIFTGCLSRDLSYWSQQLGSKYLSHLETAIKVAKPGLRRHPGSTQNSPTNKQSPSHISRVCFTPPKVPWSSTKGHRCFKMSMILVCWFYVMSKTKSLVIVLQVFEKSNFAAWRSAQLWTSSISISQQNRNGVLTRFLWMIGDWNCKW